MKNTTQGERCLVLHTGFEPLFYDRKSHVLTVRRMEYKLSGLQNGTIWTPTASPL